MMCSDSGYEHTCTLYMYFGQQMCQFIEVSSFQGVLVREAIIMCTQIGAQPP